MRRNKNKQRKIIVLSLVCFLFVMSVGYAAFQTNLTISAKSSYVEKTFTPTTLKTLAVTSGDGLYSSPYETGRYIYKGEDPNNYIWFNDEMWRILSVESNNTLKIRRVESIPSLQWDAEGNRDTSTNTYCTTETAGCNAWAATSHLLNSPSVFTQYYQNGAVSGTYYSGTVTKDSTMLTYLNETYYNTILNESKKIIVNGIWDVSTPGMTDTTLGSESYVDTDGLAIDILQTKQYQWQGKVGLITILEWMQTSMDQDCINLGIAFNNAAPGVCLNDNWLYNKKSSEWTISPWVFRSPHNVWSINVNGSIGGPLSRIARDAFPVVHLTSTIELTGRGTETRPYTIK